MNDAWLLGKRRRRAENLLQIAGGMKRMGQPAWPVHAKEGATSHTSEGRGCGKWLQLGGEWPGALLARRTRTLRRCSFDARSKGQPWPLP
jgi:hypothetical protein